MSNMEFETFGEFVGFCRAAKPEEWSEEEKNRFNEKVISLLEDRDFSKKYKEICDTASWR